MATNLTNIEYQLSDDDSLVTKTDLNGIITYANAEFERVSGFMAEELIGHPHSLIHHPDMPSEVFEDLWKTLKSSRTWCGVLKNMRKDGGYFWAMINITPDYEGGKIVGYLASRSKATTAQINFFEPKYKLFKEGKSRDLKFKNGFLYNDNLSGRFKFGKRLTIKKRIDAMIVLFSIIAISLTTVGLSTSEDNQKLNEIYSTRANTLSDVSETQKLIMENYSLVVAAINEDSPTDLKQMTQQIEMNTAEIDMLWAKYLVTDLQPDERALVEKFIVTRQKFLNEGLKPTVTALQAGDLNQAKKMVHTKITPLYKPVRDVMSDVVQFQINVTRDIYDEMQYNFKYTPALSRCF